MNLLDYITEEQKKSIIDIIIGRCRMFKEIDTRYHSQMYEPYSTMRKKHGLTPFVLSGFAPNVMNIDGLNVRDVNYGLNDKMTQPEVYNNSSVIHIYSDGSNLKSDEIKEKCKIYNDSQENPIFFIIRFTAKDDGTLKKIEVLFLDSNAKIYEKQEIYKVPKLARKSA